MWFILVLVGTALAQMPRSGRVHRDVEHCQQLIPLFQKDPGAIMSKLVTALDDACWTFVESGDFDLARYTDCSLCNQNLDSTILTGKNNNDIVNKLAVSLDKDCYGKTNWREYVKNSVLAGWGTLDDVKSCRDKCDMHMYIKGSDFEPVQPCSGCVDLVENDQYDDYLHDYPIGKFDYKKITSVSCDGTIPIDTCSLTPVTGGLPLCGSANGARIFIAPGTTPNPTNFALKCAAGLNLGCTKGTTYFIPTAMTSNINDLILSDPNTLKYSCGQNLRACVSPTECYKPKTDTGMAFLASYCFPQIPLPPPIITTPTTKKPTVTTPLLNAQCDMYMYIDGSDFEPVQPCTDCVDLKVNDQLDDYLNDFPIGKFDYKKITSVSCDGTIPVDTCSSQPGGSGSLPVCSSEIGSKIFLQAGTMPIPTNAVKQCDAASHLGCTKGTRYYIPTAGTTNMNDLVHFDKNTLKFTCGVNLRVCVTPSECYKPKTEFGIAFIASYCQPKSR